MNKADAYSANKDLFEKGKLDQFRVSGDRIGKLKKISVTVAGKTLLDEWKVEYIKVTFNKESTM